MIGKGYKTCIATQMAYLFSMKVMKPQTFPPYKYFLRHSMSGFSLDAEPTGQ